MEVIELGTAWEPVGLPAERLIQRLREGRKPFDGPPAVSGRCVEQGPRCSERSRGTAPVASDAT